MSVLASIDLVLCHHDHALSNFEIIEFLYANHWNFNDNGHKTYVPLGKDTGDFESNYLSDQAIFDILKQKQRLNENLSIVMTWKDSNIGFIFLGQSNLKVTLLLNVSRQITEYQVTDFNWYLEKVIPYFQQNGLSIIQLVCDEIR